MNFYVAGYYLIQGCSKKQDWMDRDNLLPEKIWSGSRHICSKYPDSWIFGWVTNRGIGAEQELKNVRETIKLSDKEFLAGQEDFNGLFQKDLFGFPNVFFTPELAREKYHQYFSSVAAIKLLGFALSDTYYDSFFEQYNSKDFEPITNSGVYQKLKSKELFNKDHSHIGFDLLCFNGSDYCSFLCGSMESELHEKYDIQYNQFGFISEFNKAENVSEAIRRGELPAEEGFWAPWLVFEISLQ